jgi:hypothetical protein
VVAAAVKRLLVAIGIVLLVAIGIVLLVAIGWYFLSQPQYGPCRGGVYQCGGPPPSFPTVCPGAPRPSNCPLGFPTPTP